MSDKMFCEKDGDPVEVYPVWDDKYLKNIRIDENYLKGIILQSRGDHDEHSDIDLLVIASKLLHWKEEKAIIGALFDIGMEYNVIFSPLFTSVDEWENGIFTKFPVYQEISRDGAVVL